MTALDAAIEYGGWNLGQDAGIDEQAIRDYFTEANFATMFPGENVDDLEGNSLEECAEAVIEWQREWAAAQTATPADQPESTPQERIIELLRCWEDYGFSVVDMILQWRNAAEVVIDSDGDVWIRATQGDTGTWLLADEIDEFLRWQRATEDAQRDMARRGVC